MTIYSRRQLGTQLEVAIAADVDIEAVYNVVTDPRELSELDPHYDAYLQLVRQRIVPNPPNPRGQLQETFEIWVVLVAKVDDELVEDALDDRLEELITILDRFDWLVFVSAERRVHPSQQPAYLISATLTTDKP